MTRTFLAGLVLVSWIDAPAAQQSPAPTTTEPAHKVFVLTGCLEQGTAPSAFKLTRASAIGQPPPRPARATTTSNSKVEGVYDLQPAASVSQEGLSRDRLQAEVGARVEVTIRPVEMPAPAPPPLAATKDAGDKPVDSPAPPQTYTVVRLNRLAESCS